MPQQTRKLLDHPWLDCGEPGSGLYERCLGVNWILVALCALPFMALVLVDG